MDEECWGDPAGARENARSWASWVQKIGEHRIFHDFHRNLAGFWAFRVFESGLRHRSHVLYAVCHGH